MQKEFKLETILTITTGINLTDDFNEVFELAYFIYDDPNINTVGLSYLKDNIKAHLYKLHPELIKIQYVPQSEKIRKVWIEDMKKYLSEFLPVSQINQKLNIVQKIKTR